MSLREAIQRYHDLLTDELGSASYAQLEDQQRRRGLFFGGRSSIAFSNRGCISCCVPSTRPITPP